MVMVVMVEIVVNPGAMVVMGVVMAVVVAMMGS